MLSIAFIIAIGFLAILIFDFISKRKRNLCFEKSKIRGPKAYPIIGCGLDLIKLGPEDVIPYFGQLFEKFGRTFRLWMLHEAHVYTTDIEIFEELLTSTTQLEKGDLYDLLRSWLNDGLLLSTGRKWHSRRKIFTPAFHFKGLQHFVEIFDKQSGIMAEKLAAYAWDADGGHGGQEVNVFEFVGPAALDSIAEAAMGVQVHAQLHPEFPYVQALKRVTYIQSDRLYKIKQRYDCTFKIAAPKLYRELQASIKTMHDFTNEIIENRRATIAGDDGRTLSAVHSGTDDGRRNRMAFLDILLQSTIDGRPLTNQEICEEVDTFTFEGDDTTTSGISHALYCISRHPGVQQKLFEEIREVMGNDRTAPISMALLNQLKYMDCFIKEVLRLYPPVPAVGRRIDTDLLCADGRIILPANTNVYLVLYYAHRNPKYFQDPHAFRPERFEVVDGGDDEDEEHHKKKKNPFAYVPFSAGPKNCIGQKFALLEMKAMISKILRYYELLPRGPPIEPMMNFILRSTCGMHLGLRLRNY